MARRRNIVIWTALGLAGAVAAGATTMHQARAERADCPGKIVCPVTGELVCRDKCPLIDADRADCPGRIECPLTGELVCRDRCPVGEETAADQSAALPACCQTGG